MRKILSIAFSMLVFSLYAHAQNDWKGSYSFDENGGKNAGGAVIFISHELSIFDADDELAGRLQSNGYQTAADLICSTKVEGSKLLVYFQSYGEDNMFEPYKPGDLLLTLERKNEKGKVVILTYWGKFTPAIPKNSKTGKVYFEMTPKVNT
jgi:hypothetical protein